MGSRESEPSMARLAAKYLKKKYDKPGNVFVGVVSRIDKLVSGVLVFARTSKAASRLSNQIREHKFEKRYMAWIEGRPDGNNGEWTEVVDWVAKNEQKQRMEIVAHKNRTAKEAVLRWRLVATDEFSSVVEVELITGRKHQIRLQLSAMGHPIVGDQKYGSQRKLLGAVALHCHSLALDHPTQKERLTFRAPPPQWSGLSKPLQRELAERDSLN